MKNILSSQITRDVGALNDAQQHDVLPLPQRYLSVEGVWLALIFCVLDSFVANLVLPTIARDLGVLKMTLEHLKLGQERHPVRPTSLT